MPVLSLGTPSNTCPNASSDASPDMGNQQGQCGWGHAVDPAGLADGLGPYGGQLLARLIRMPLDRRIVEPRRKDQTLVPPEGRNVGGLAIQIDVILGIDLELLKDPVGKVAKARPDPPNRIDPDRWEGQELEGAATLAIPIEGQAVSPGFVRREGDRSSKFRGGRERAHLLGMEALPLQPHTAESNAFLGQSLISIVRPKREPIFRP